MNALRKILFSFSILYEYSLQLFGIFFFYWCFLNPTFSVPTIVVGNLSVGGTGKSPQIEYLIRLLSLKFKVATLSRGLKEKRLHFSR
jgi:tetraacyldisaccharide 4'-kinase